MFQLPIPLFKVHMPANIGDIVGKVLTSGVITEGPQAKHFEEMFQEWIGNPYTALCNSGTSALMLALRLAGVGPGDEVITSPMTCLATNEPILMAGAIPVWCDVDPKTGNIDPKKIEELVTGKTKAILFVDWAGTPCELDAIEDIAKTYNLKTIEDAAHSLGARYRRQLVGTICDYTCFSFQAIKHLTTVDGGAIACRTKEDYDRAVLLRWFGCKRGHNSSPVKWTGDVTEPGYKMHMNDVNATIGIHQMDSLRDRISTHKANGLLLTKWLGEHKNIELLDVPCHIDSSYWIYTIKLENEQRREEVSKALNGYQIGNNIVHTRNDEYSLFKNFKRELPGLDDFGSRMLSIPCGWWVNRDSLEYIVETLYKVA